MATYGSRDKNPFQAPETFLLNGVSTPSNLGKTRYYLLVEADGPNKGQITIKSPTVAGNIGGANADRTVGVIPLDNSFRPTPGNATTEEVKYFSSVAGQKSVKNHAIITAQKAGAAQPTAQQLVVPNTATSTGVGTPATEGAGSGVSEEELEKESKTSNKNTRKTYDPADIKYPLKLKLENQDCIKFSIVEYIAPGLKPGSSEAGSRIVTLINTKPNFGSGKDRKILATITLPIPAGIGDRNSADWQSNQIGELERALSNVSVDSILKGFSAGAETAGTEAGRVANNSGDASKAIASFFAQQAAGSSNLISRKFGAVVNPNLELLFNGPTLRNFTFNFRFTPREPAEAVAVRKIIRYFKQAMSVKRSTSSLLLKAPHTFAISYLSNNKDHPYLNRFKECALTDCAVNYTPDGTYMTYTDSSMTAYELSLTFQELEPIFDDEYYEIDKNQDTSIGF